MQGKERVQGMILTLSHKEPQLIPHTHPVTIDTLWSPDMDPTPLSLPSLRPNRRLLTFQIPFFIRLFVAFSSTLIIRPLSRFSYTLLASSSFLSAFYLFFLAPSMPLSFFNAFFSIAQVRFLLLLR